MPRAKISKTTGFSCPHDDCGGLTTVRRTTTAGQAIRRVRMCKRCGKRFVTVEAVQKNGTNSADARICIETLISELKTNPLTSSIVQKLLKERNR